MLINIDSFSMQPAESNPVTYQKGLEIKGRIEEQGSNIPCRVCLFSKLTNRLVQNVATDLSGNYSFNHLNNSVFFIIAHHPLNQFNAVIQDNVVPK